MSKQIKISDILTDLENGVTRSQIATKYDISDREVKALFNHPKLKGKKAKKVFTPSFDIIDDTEPIQADMFEETTEETVVESDTEYE